jgi:sterol desaturase/sphingolipid hydroxylase (fatty acid hydroxylase superfamily)
VGGVLGVGLETALTAGVLALIVQSSQHINADMWIGPLRWIFVHTDAHRWHHDLAPPGAIVCNYSNVFTFWDLAGGTFRQPHRFRGEYGLEPFRDRYPEGMWRQAVSIGARRHAALLGAADAPNQRPRAVH